MHSTGDIAAQQYKHSAENQEYIMTALAASTQDYLLRWKNRFQNLLTISTSGTMPSEDSP